MYNAMRITRTEAHRISQQAAYDALKKAKDNGADVVKQWDATLDKRTRPSHARVDGEIRELDEPFSNGLMKPGDPNGRAAEVINCRCQLLQRARCALDEDELDELKERAAYFGLDKTADFEEFRRKYIPASIANSENSGIINYKEVYRKKSEQSNYGISQKRFDELTIEAKKNGATILRGTDEIEKHLDSVNAQAATLGDTMLFRKNVRVCDVLEESYHFMQNKKGINIDKTEPLRTYLNEIEAKQFIIDNERKYKVPRIEIEETKRQLSEYQKALKKWRDDNDL